MPHRCPIGLAIKSFYQPINFQINMVPKKISPTAKMESNMELSNFAQHFKSKTPNFENIN